MQEKKDSYQKLANFKGGSLNSKTDQALLMKNKKFSQTLIKKISEMENDGNEDQE